MCVTKLSCKCRKKREKENKKEKMKMKRKTRITFIVCTLTYLPDNYAKNLT